MEADTLTRIDTTAQTNFAAYPDSTALMLHEWNYSGNTAPLIDTKIWLQDTIQHFYQRQSLYYPRHDGTIRPDRMMSESILLVMLLLEIVFVAFLIRNGLRFINKSIRAPRDQGDRVRSSDDAGQPPISSSQILWILSAVVFTLIISVLLSLKGVQTSYDQDRWVFVRHFSYVLLYFIAKYILYRLVGLAFFNKHQIGEWLEMTKAIISFYALYLSPILIFAEVGIFMQSSFVYTWILAGFIVGKIVQLMKSVDIFSIKIEGIFYLILYLCTLEILPILLFYKGLFLI